MNAGQPSEDLLEDRFSGCLEKGRARRNHNLRKLQYESAKRGNVVMLIWLGKQWLGQKERPIEDDAIDPLRELLAEYRKRYDYLSHSEEYPEAEKAKFRKKISKQEEEKDK
jgi:hypothetical protein